MPMSPNRGKLDWTNDKASRSQDSSSGVQLARPFGGLSGTTGIGALPLSLTFSAFKGSPIPDHDSLLVALYSCLFYRLLAWLSAHSDLP